MIILIKNTYYKVDIIIIFFPLVTFQENLKVRVGELAGDLEVCQTELALQKKKMDALCERDKLRKDQLEQTVILIVIIIIM